MMRLLRLNAGEEPAPSLNAVYAALPTTIPDGDGVELRVPVIPAAGAEGVVPDARRADAPHGRPGGARRGAERPGGVGPR